MYHDTWSAKARVCRPTANGSTAQNSHCFCRLPVAVWPRGCEHESKHIRDNALTRAYVSSKPQIRIGRRLLPTMRLEGSDWTSSGNLIRGNPRGTRRLSVRSHAALGEGMVISSLFAVDTFFGTDCAIRCISTIVIAFICCPLFYIPLFFVVGAGEPAVFCCRLVLAASIAIARNQGPPSMTSHVRKRNEAASLPSSRCPPTPPFPMPDEQDQRQHCRSRGAHREVDGRRDGR